MELTMEELTRMKQYVARIGPGRTLHELTTEECDDLALMLKKFLAAEEIEQR